MAEQLVFDFDEVWKPIPGHPSYEVSNLGRARSLDRIIENGGDNRRGPYRRKWRGRLLRPSPDAAGYWHSYPFGRIHCAVMLAFVGPCPDGLEVRHIDGKKNNNRLANLCYGTRTDNMADAVLHGTTTRGEKNAMAKLTAAQARLIKYGKFDLQALADRFGIHIKHAERIRRGGRWGWL